jgi:outer membrane protein assembly factor BamB
LVVQRRDDRWISGPSSLIVSRDTNPAAVWTWTDPAGATIGDSAVTPSVVYVGVVGPTESRLYAFKATNGAVLWNRVVAANARLQPTVANGVVYLGRNAYDARNGELLWSNPDLVDTVSPIVVNGRLYANDVNGNVTAWGLQ